MGGWGRRGRVGSRRLAKATIWTQAAVLCPSVWDQNRHNPQGGPRLPLEALSLVPHAVLLVPPAQGREMHRRGFTASIKSRL